MPVNLTAEGIAWLITVGSAVGSMLFWGVFHLGQIKSELIRAHRRLDDHDDVHDEVLGELQLRRRGDHTRNRTSQD